MTYVKQIQTAADESRRLFQLVKKLSKRPRFLYNIGNGGVFMEQWRKDARKEPIIIDIDSLVPADLRLCGDRR